MQLVVHSKGEIHEEKNTYELKVLRQRASSMGGMLQFHCNNENQESLLKISIPL